MGAIPYIFIRLLLCTYQCGIFHSTFLCLLLIFPNAAVFVAEQKESEESGANHEAAPQSERLDTGCRSRIWLSPVAESAPAKQKPADEDQAKRGKGVSQSKPLRVCVLGTGHWGQKHIEAYWRNPDTQLAAICGQSNRERVERLARQYGTTGYLDFGEMLDKEKPDLVSIITPDDQHYLPYKQALNAGVNCFLEKPLCMDVEQGQELVYLARRKGVHCGINFNHRYATPFLLVKQHLEEGKVGRELFLHWRFTGGHYPERQTLPLAHLLYMQSHGFNMLQTFGGEIVSIVGHAYDPRETRQFTTATFSLQFASGAVGSFVAGVDGDYKDPDIYGFELMGDRGRVRVDDAIRRFEYAPRPNIVQTHQEQKGMESLAHVWNSHFFDDESRDFARTTDRHIADFVRAMRAGDPEPIPVEEGLAALEVGQRAINSIRPLPDRATNGQAASGTTTEYEG